MISPNHRQPKLQQSHPVVGEERLGSGPERHCRGGQLVGQHLAVGQPGVVIDGGVHELQPDLLAASQGGVLAGPVRWSV